MASYKRVEAKIEYTLFSLKTENTPDFARTGIDDDDDYYPQYLRIDVSYFQQPYVNVLEEDWTYAAGSEGWIRR